MSMVEMCYCPKCRQSNLMFSPGFTTGLKVVKSHTTVRCRDCHWKQTFHNANAARRVLKMRICPGCSKKVPKHGWCEDCDCCIFCCKAGKEIPTHVKVVI